MLVLKRKAGERIRIGDDVTVLIAAVDGNKVSVGIEAPRQVQIMREELLPEYQQTTITTEGTP